MWVVISGKVFDVTEFQDEHPGGEDVFMVILFTNPLPCLLIQQDCAGGDATQGHFDAHHSPSAVEMMVDFFIGVVEKK